MLEANTEIMRVCPNVFLRKQVLSNCPNLFPKFLRNKFCPTVQFECHNWREKKLERFQCLAIWIDMRPDLCRGSFLLCRFEALRRAGSLFQALRRDSLFRAGSLFQALRRDSLFPAGSLFIFINKKLKERHWKEDLFVATMHPIIEIVGLIASVRDMIIGIHDSLGKKGGCGHFVKYLTVVEDVLTPYMSAVWQENSKMRRIVKAVRGELRRAWVRVERFRNKNPLARRFMAGSFAKNLERSAARIQRFLSLVPIVAVTRTQDGHAHSGNEDMDLAIALYLSEKENGHAHSGTEDMDLAIALYLSEKENGHAREANTGHMSEDSSQGDDD